MVIDHQHSELYYGWNLINLTRRVPRNAFCLKRSGGGICVYIFLYQTINYSIKMINWDTCTVYPVNFCSQLKKWILLHWPPRVKCLQFFCCLRRSNFKPSILSQNLSFVLQDHYWSLPNVLLVTNHQNGQDLSLAMAWSLPGSEIPDGVSFSGEGGEES